MFAGDLRFARAPSNGKVEIQDSSTGEAAAFQVVPAANHFGGDAEILCDRLNRIAFANLVACDGVRVGAGVAVFARGDWDDQTGFGCDRAVVQSVVQIIGFGDCSWSRVISSGDGGQRFAILHFVITPPDALVGGNLGDRRLKLG